MKNIGTIGVVDNGSSLIASEMVKESKKIEDLKLDGVYEITGRGLMPYEAPKLTRQQRRKLERDKKKNK